MSGGMRDLSRADEADRELIRRMASRDSKALEAFYDQYNRLAFSLVLRIVGSREDAEDVLVDVFWQVWQQAARYDETRGKPIAWLLTVARTRAIDCMRSRGRKMTSVDNPGEYREPTRLGPQPDPFVAADTRDAVVDALKTLSDEQRVPLEMAYYRGMSHTEIAEALRQPLGTIKDRIRNGMMHLRKRLRPYV